MGLSSAHPNQDLNLWRWCCKAAVSNFLQLCMRQNLNTRLSKHLKIDPTNFKEPFCHKYYTSLMHYLGHMNLDIFSRTIQFFTSTKKCFELKILLMLLIHPYTTLSSAEMSKIFHFPSNLSLKKWNFIVKAHFLLIASESLLYSYCPRNKFCLQCYSVFSHWDSPLNYRLLPV